MKKTLGLTLSAFLILMGMAFAQSSNQNTGKTDPQSSNGSYSSQSSQSGTMGQSSAASEVKGTISQDGKTLVGDDGKSWTISNPDAVKGNKAVCCLMNERGQAMPDLFFVASGPVRRQGSAVALASRRRSRKFSTPI